MHEGSYPPENGLESSPGDPRTKTARFHWKTGVGWTALTVLLMLGGFATWRWQDSDAAGTGPRHVPQWMKINPPAPPVNPPREMVAEAKNTYLQATRDFTRGNLEEAETLFRKSLEMYRALWTRFPESTTLPVDISAVSFHLGEVLDSKENYSGAQVAFQEAVEILKKHLIRNPDDSLAVGGLMYGHRMLGRQLISLEKLQEAEDQLRQGQDCLSGLKGTSPPGPVLRFEAAAIMHELAEVKLRQGDLEATETFYRQSLEALQELSAQYDSNSSLLEGQFLIYQRLGKLLLNKKRLSEAEALFRKGLDIHRSAPENVTADLHWQVILFDMFAGLGMTLSEQNRVVDAAFLLRKSIEIAEIVVSRQPHNSYMLGALVHVYARLGYLVLQEGRSDEAHNLLQKSISMIRRLAARHPSQTRHKRDLALFLSRGGRMLGDAGNKSDALKMIREALEILPNLIALDPENAELQTELLAGFISITKISDLKTAREMNRKAREQFLKLKKLNLLSPEEDARFRKGIRGGL